MKRPSPLIILFTLLLWTMNVVASAETIHGVAFSDVYMDEHVIMDLLGTGHKKILFTDVFVAGFYLHTDAGPDDALSDVAKRMEVSYFTDVGAKRLADYIRKRMSKNMSSEEFEEVESRIEKMHDFFVDLDAGDRFSMTYIPDIGTKFERNNTFLGVVEGADFGRGIFATWVGERPFDKSVKQQVLGLE